MTTQQPKDPRLAGVLYALNEVEAAVQRAATQAGSHASADAVAWRDGIQHAATTLVGEYRRLAGQQGDPDEERRKLIRALLLTVAESWRYGVDFDEWWQHNYAWVRGDQSDEEAPQIGSDVLYATLGAIACAMGVQSEPEWAAALAKAGGTHHG